MEEPTLTSPKKSKTKISKFSRIIGLFEISRPNKTRLLRTNSLPASRASHSETKTSRGLLKSYSNGESKVQKLKEEIEQRCNKDYVPSTPKPVKKKLQRQIKEDQSRENWLLDKEKIMEDINKLQERIEDVTQEIQNSDTELEITFDNVFEETLIDKLSDDDSETSNFTRLSGDTVLHRVSSDTIEEEDIIEFENNISASLIPYRRSFSAEAVYEISRDSGASKTRLENNEGTAKTTEDHIEEAHSSEESTNNVNHEEIITHEDTESLDEKEYYEAAESSETNNNDSHSQTSTNEDEYYEAVESNEESEFIDNDSSHTSANEDAQTEPDSIEWWKHKSFVQINQENSLENDETKQNTYESSSFTGRFIKNNRSRRNKRTDKRRTGILQKPLSVRELTKRYEGFQDAADKGETENYRKSFIEEMDMEIENMLNDGFRDDFHLSFENLTLLSNDETVNKTEINLDDLSIKKSEDEEASPVYQTIIILPNQEEQQYEDSDQDLFGETYFREDLEKGLYYLETYNADGKELIMCSVQVERQSVDLNSFDKMKANSCSKFLTNDESMLVLMGEANESKSGTDSKRTTIYSTTSGESYEDEGIDIEQASGTYGSNASARRETYCDEQGIVRIERVGPYPPEETQDYKTTINYYYSGEEDEGAKAVVDEENYYEFVTHQEIPVVSEIKKETLQYILDEIKSTEKKYVSDIRKVLKEYKSFLEERCPEKVDVVFANLEQIYQGQLQFMEVLEAADEDIIEVARAFIDFEDLFRLYPRYFKNTPRANVAVKDLGFLIKEKQDKINDKLHLSAYLLTPLQRLGKYKLFLENIIKQLGKEGKSIGAVQMALDVVKKYMSRGNDAVAIASILFSPLHTREYGAFISREKFALLKPKRMEVMVFLFEDVIVFTTEDLKSMEQFIYHQSIKTNDLRIATYDDTTIHLTDYTKTKRRNSSKYTYILDAKTDKLKMAWKQQIEEILWMQMKKIKENTLKEYQSESNKNKHPSNRKLAKSREQRSKSTGNKPTGLFGFNAFLYK
ncbi:unnamed protein product [Ceutorhynchus assimilis]|uniref:DH domain-containing protein n=1 Tax=Ceutorhynchus assimilis TaxID=467358 RepID=A0A9N9MSB2_9CUCU|nr:unnamed protein product [Ceutorhynchus assimilis]